MTAGRVSAFTLLGRVSRSCHGSRLECGTTISQPEEVICMTIRIHVASAALAALAFAGVAAAQDVTGAGASFPAPLYARWAADYNKATGVKINYQSVGSGAGIKQIDAKTVAFGASDMPLKDEELAKKGQIQFPTVIGGVIP